MKTTAQTVIRNLLGDKAFQAAKEDLSQAELRTVEVIVAQKYAAILRSKCDKWEFLLMLKRFAWNRKGTVIGAQADHAENIMRKACHGC